MAEDIHDRQKVKVAPSVLSAHPLKLESQVRQVASAGADMLHLDIMDGNFVPNLTFGPAAAKALSSMNLLPLDVHLMVSAACLDWAVPAFAEAGARYITVHQEVTPHLSRTLRSIRELGVRSAVALNPSTSPDFLPFVLDEIDMVLIMTVNPGFGGQAFIPAMLKKIEVVREMIDRAGVQCEIEVDGGIDAATAGEVVAKGATILVAGSYVFSASDPGAAVCSLKMCSRGR